MTKGRDIATLLKPQECWIATTNCCTRTLVTSTKKITPQEAIQDLMVFSFKLSAPGAKQPNSTSSSSVETIKLYRFLTIYV